MLSVCLAVPHSIHPCVVCMPFFLSVSLSASLFSVHLSVCQYVRLSVCPLLSFWHAPFHSLCLSSVGENEKGVYGTYSRNEDPVPAPLTERKTLRHQRRWTWTGDFKCREVKTGFCRKRWTQTGSSATLIGWKSGQTTFIPPWDRMEGAWLMAIDSGNADRICSTMLKHFGLGRTAFFTDDPPSAS